MGFLHIGGLGAVHFHEYGTGKKPLLAFHGYGMTGKQFHVLQHSVLQDYHVYGFDHFFHGESKLDNWTEKEILAGMPKAMVREYVEEWFKIYGSQRFSVMAYSIGANLALLIVEEYADLVDEIILMAPDGLSIHKGFNILMHRGWGKYLFSRITKNKWLAPVLLKSLRKARFIDDSLYQIAYNEIDSKQKRLDVYYTLNLIKMLTPDINKITALINQHKIKCLLIFGKHDKLFPKKAAMPFINSLTDAEVHELQLGHWLITPALDNYLINLPA